MNQSSPLAPRQITVFGGSGFVGRHVVKKLAEAGWRVKVACRRPHLAGFLQPLGLPGQIVAVQANLRDDRSVAAALSRSEAVINLVGLLFERGKQTFDAVHREGVERLALAARSQGIRTIAHLSALGAQSDSPARYGVSKWQGEQALLSVVSEARIFRPSLIFGPEDGLFNRFAALVRLSPVLPYVSGSRRFEMPYHSSRSRPAAPDDETLFQPVYVGDVAEAIVKSLDKPDTAGKIFELGGTELLTFAAMMIRMLDEIDRQRLMMPLPRGIAACLARCLQYVPGTPLTPDQVALLSRDNLVSEEAKADHRTLEGLGCVPHDLGAVLPSYLVQYRKAGEFTRPQSHRR